MTKTIQSNFLSQILGRMNIPRPTESASVRLASSSSRACKAASMPICQVAGIS
jgi:hypothetical protein